MRIEFNNGKNLIVKISYETIPHIIRKKDNLNRLVEIKWNERLTKITINQQIHHNTDSVLIAKGIAKCHNLDKWNPNVGKSIAYCRALEAAESAGIITHNEAVAMAQFKLNASVYKIEL